MARLIVFFVTFFVVGVMIGAVGWGFSIHPLVVTGKVVAAVAALGMYFVVSVRVRQQQSQ